MSNPDSPKPLHVVFKEKGQQNEQWLKTALQDWKSRNKYVYVESGYLSLSAAGGTSLAGALDSLTELFFEFTRRDLDACVLWFPRWGFSVETDAIAALDGHKRLLFNRMRNLWKSATRHIGNKDTVEEALNNLRDRIEKELIENHYRLKLLTEWHRQQKAEAANRSEEKQLRADDDDFSISGPKGILRRASAADSEDHVEGFRSFSYVNRNYCLTRGEARRVEVLWKRLKSGPLKVQKSALKLGSTEFKPSKVFSTKDGKAFRRDFIRDDSGKYWLDVP